MTGRFHDDVLHPGLLDACLQITGALSLEQEMDDARLPFAIRHMRVDLRAEGRACWGHGRRVEKNGWNLRLLDQDGLVLAEISGFEDRPVPRGAFGQARPLRDWLLTLDWLPKKPSPLAAPAATVAGTWLILDGHEGVGDLVAKELRLRGGRCILVSRGSSYSPPKPAGERQAAAVAGAEDFRRLFADVLETSTLAGVVYLAPCAERGPGGASDEAVPERVESLCVDLLGLTQALAGADPVPRLWVVTRGAQAVGAGEAVEVGHRPLWGLARAVTAEHPELECTCVDLDGGGGDGQVAMLVAEMFGEHGEGQVALRGAGRYVARLVRWQPPSHSKEAVQLKLLEYGTPDNLQLKPLRRRAPKSLEVEIEVHAAGLNFRDVLIALGMLQGYYAEALNMQHAREHSARL